MGLDPIYSTLLGALGGFISSFLLRGWQYNQDQWYKRSSSLCDELGKLADLCVDYWVEIDISKNRAREARILGLQSRIDAMVFVVSRRFNETDRNRADSKLAEVRDVVTGGNFQTKDAVLDYDRARLIHFTISGLIVHIENGTDRSGFWKRLYYNIVDELPFKKRYEIEY